MQETFNERVAQLQDLISEHVKQDPRPFYSYEEYEQSIPTLTSYVQKSMDNLQRWMERPPLAMEAARWRYGSRRWSRHATWRRDEWSRIVSLTMPRPKASLAGTRLPTTTVPMILLTTRREVAPTLPIAKMKEILTPRLKGTNLPCPSYRLSDRALAVPTKTAIDAAPAVTTEPSPNARSSLKIKPNRRSAHFR